MELSGQLGGTHGEHIREVDQDAVPLAWELETEALGGLQGVVQDLPPTPSAARMSRAFWTRPAPSRIRAWVPTESGEKMLPGTAITSLCRSRAASAVIRAPEPCTASTTTTASESAAMVRLQAGKLWRRGDVPSGNGLTSAPPAARISSARRKCAAG